MGVGNGVSAHYATRVVAGKTLETKWVMAEQDSARTMSYCTRRSARWLYGKTFLSNWLTDAFKRACVLSLWARRFRGPFRAKNDRLHPV